jgi:hypothetical protein
VKLAPRTSTAFSNSTIAQQNQLVADLVAAETSHEGAVTGSTHENHTRSWHRFSRYLESIGIGHNIFLDSFRRSQQNKIIGAFDMALRQGQFLGSAHDTLALGTIRNTILDISAILRENGQPNPTKDNDLQLSFILHRQFRAFKNADPKEKQQKAILACVIAIILVGNVANMSATCRPDTRCRSNSGQMGPCRRHKI